MSIFGDVLGSIGMVSHPGRGAGRSWPVMPGQTVGATQLLPSADDLFLVPLAANNFTAPIKSVQVYCTTGGGAGAALKAGIWRLDMAAGRPTGTPLAYNNAGAAATGTGLITIPLNVDFSHVLSGAYAVGIIGASASPLPTLIAQPNGDGAFIGFAGFAVGASPAATLQRWTVNGVGYSTDISIVSITAASTNGGNTTPYICVGT